ncbi:MAG TPA: 2-C-methyl-D-erythritol 4-phosphate cytidylyltransferase [Longimicrobiales bacterium]|nr:2-C-methyl-D-erythritol 4-phosphate cytidylyltransferase [Longimicrobiales bacterium]
MTPSARVGVVVPAAGSGQRMGGVRKPFLELDGEPVLTHALRPFLADPRVIAVVVALSPADADDPPLWIAGSDDRVRIVAGGDTRAESVRNALSALPEVDVVAVHDAARPLVTADVVDRCIEVALAGEGAVAGCPAVDTVKRVDDGGRIVDTPDRARLWYAHTPQVFPADMIRRAYAMDLSGATDDASLVERTGAVVRMVDGGASNLKVTRAEDLSLAETLLRGRLGAAR